MLAKLNRNFSNAYECIFFVYVFVFTIAVSLLLKLIKIQTLLEWLTPPKKSFWEGKIPVERLSKYVDSILALQILGIKPSCLNRSLILYHFLYKIGIQVKINFGVRKTEKDIQGHGWLTMNEKPYLEKDSTFESFCLIYSYPCSRQVLKPQVRLEGTV